MNVLIIEDEKFAAERIVTLLQQEEKDIIIDATLDTVKTSIEYLNEHRQPDLIFMDIQLGDGKSFDIFKQTNITCPVIFTTAFDEYAIQAFKHNGIDYLLKPLKRQDLSFAINKYKTQHNRQLPHSYLLQIANHLKPQAQEYRSRFLVKIGTRFFSINANEIAFFYTKDKLQYLKTYTGIDYIIDNNLDQLEVQLNPEIFFRVNRQFIVSHKAIDKIHAWFDGKIKLTLNPAGYEDIIISRLKANDFKAWLGK